MKVGDLVQTIGYDPMVKSGTHGLVLNIRRYSEHVTLIQVKLLDKSFVEPMQFVKRDLEVINYAE
jgi:hypothetical protein